MRSQVFTAVQYFTVVLGLVINDLKELHASVFTVKYLMMKAEKFKTCIYSHLCKHVQMYIHV